MSISPNIANKRFEQAIEEKDKAANRKLDLLEKMKKKSKERDNSKDENLDKIKDLSTKLKKANKEIDQIGKKLRDAETDNRNISKELRLTEDKFIDMKNDKNLLEEKILNYEEELESLNIQLDSVNSLYEEESRERRSLEQQINELKSLDFHEELSKLNRELSSFKRENHNLKAQVESRDNRYNKEKLKRIKIKEDNDRLLSKINKLEKDQKNSVSESSNDNSLKFNIEKVSPVDLINSLINQLNDSNISEFKDIEEFYSLYLSKKLINVPEPENKENNKTPKSKSKSKSNNDFSKKALSTENTTTVMDKEEMKNKLNNWINGVEEEDKSDQRIGYVTKRKNKCWFVDIETQEEMKVDVLIPKFWKDGDVAKVDIKDDGKVILLYVYPNDQKSIRNKTIEQRKVKSKSKGKSKGKSKNEVEDKKDNVDLKLKELEDKHVVIVTAENASTYIQHMKKYMDNVESINGYEQSLQRVRSLMEKSDVCIVCKNAIPHAVTDYIRQNPDPKYQIMNNPSKEDLLARVRYMVLHALVPDSESTMSLEELGIDFNFDDDGEE